MKLLTEHSMAKLLRRYNQFGNLNLFMFASEIEVDNIPKRPENLVELLFDTKYVDALYDFYVSDFTRFDLFLGSISNPSQKSINTATEMVNEASEVREDIPNNVPSQYAHLIQKPTSSPNILIERLKKYIKHGYIIKSPEFIKLFATILEYRNQYPTRSLPALSFVPVNRVEFSDTGFSFSRIANNASFDNVKDVLNYSNMPPASALSTVPTGRKMVARLVLVERNNQTKKLEVVTSAMESIPTTNELKVSLMQFVDSSYHYGSVTGYWLIEEHDDEAVPGPVKDAIKGNCLLLLADAQSKYDSSIYNEFNEQQIKKDPNYAVKPTELPEGLLKQMGLKLRIFSDFQSKLISHGYKVKPWVTVDPYEAQRKELNSTQKGRKLAHCNVIVHDGHASPTFTKEQLKGPKTIKYASKIKYDQFSKVLREDQYGIQSIISCSSYDPKSKNPKFTITKTYKPSERLFKIAANDQDQSFNGINNQEQHLWKIMSENNNVKITRNNEIYDLIKYADLEPSSGFFWDNTSTYPKHDYVIDHVRSFASFEKSDFYRGIPQPPYILTNEFIGDSFGTKTSVTWFVVIKSIKNVPEAFKKFYYHRYQDLNNPVEAGFECLNVLIYDFLIRHGAKIEVLGFINGSTIHFDFDYLLEKGNLNGSDRESKDTRNRLIGLIIAGGHGDKKRYTTYTKDSAEIDHMITECVTHGITNFIHSCDSASQHKFTYELQKNSGRRSFDIHGTILAYSALAVLEKMTEVLKMGQKIVGFKRDSIFVNINGRDALP
jgi:hypothetical protein